MSLASGTYWLDFGTLQVHEAAANLIAVLAFPELAANSPVLDHHYRAICAWAVRRRLENQPALAEEIQPLRPSNLLLDVDQIEQAMEAVKVRIEHRLVAGRIAMPFLIRAESGPQAVVLPESVTELSLNQVAGFHAERAGMSDVQNIKNRIWYPSLPVIHVAAALELAHEAAANLQSMPILDVLTVSREIIEWVVRRAEAFEPWVGKMGFRKQSALIKFRLS